MNEYIDFGAIYKGLANAAKKAKSKAETFSDLFAEKARSFYPSNSEQV